MNFEVSKAFQKSFNHLKTRNLKSATAIFAAFDHRKDI